MSKRSFILSGLPLTLLGAALILAVGAHRFLTTAVAPPAPVRITIPGGASFDRTAKLLEEKGVVSSAWQLKLLARLKKSTTRIQAGTYLFETEAVPAQVLQRLVAGDIIQLKLVIPEGWTVTEIARRIQELGLGKEEAVLALAENPDFIRKLSLEAASLEGYLFPDTYTFPDGTPEERLLEAMVRQFHSRLTPELKQQAADRGLTLHQLTTLASIIQKESGNRSEMPLISAVFHNRLRKGIPLQADPTVIYGIPDFDGNLTRRHLATFTPYNTYLIRGLPPGPIANPGLEALQAAVHPAPVNHLYFVSRGDGSHIFSDTLAEHNEAVLRFQKRRRR
ncbi:MAG: endolytic transglycosylase MltG [Deltaproteobacteria bacterium]|nr:endolytic transglycosylase MltG [Deltaproteobacteria bacterium]